MSEHLSRMLAEHERLSCLQNRTPSEWTTSFTLAAFLDGFSNAIEIASQFLRETKHPDEAKAILDLLPVLFRTSGETSGD